MMSSKNLQESFKEFRNGTYKPLISSHVLFELENGAPQHIIII